MDGMIAQLIDMIWMIGDLLMGAFVSSPIIALTMTFLLSFFIWHDWKIFVDMLLLLGVMVVVMTVAQQGMGLVDAAFHVVSTTPGLK